MWTNCNIMNKKIKRKRNWIEKKIKNYNITCCFIWKASTYYQILYGNFTLIICEFIHVRFLMNKQVDLKDWLLDISNTSHANCKNWESVEKSWTDFNHFQHKKTLCKMTDIHVLTPTGSTKWFIFGIWGLK